MALAKELLDLLACPSCKAEIVLVPGKADALFCVNAGCRRCYRIEDDIPILLVDESSVLAEPEWRGAIAKT